MFLEALRTNAARWAFDREYARTRETFLTSSIAGMWACACFPVPMIPRVSTSLIARMSVATAELAAVLIAQIDVAARVDYGRGGW